MDLVHFQNTDGECGVFKNTDTRMGTDEWMRGAGALACGANTENREKGGTEN